MYKRSLTLIVTLLFLFLVATPAWANSLDKVIGVGEIQEDVVVWENLTIEEGAIVNGDVVVWAGNMVSSGTVTGDVVIFGGNATIENSAEIIGDLIIFGGNATIKESAKISGECIVLGGTLNGTPSQCAPVGLGNDLTQLKELDNNFFSNHSEFSEGWHGDRGDGVGNHGLVSLLFFLINLVGIGVIAALISAVALKPLQRIGQTIRYNTPMMFGVGLLTFVSVISLIVLLSILSTLLIIVCVGIFGFPIILGLMLLFAAAILVGWVAVSNLLGEELVARFGINRLNFVWTTVLGAIVLHILLTLLAFIPTIGSALATLASFFIFNIGLGATALTRFGKRPYPYDVVSIS